jgi:hypothetical protein
MKENLSECIGYDITAVVYLLMYVMWGMCRWRDSGDEVRVVKGKIYYVDRADFVVKIYGKRVNPFEVTTILKQCSLFTDVLYDDTKNRC